MHETRRRSRTATRVAVPRCDHEERSSFAERHSASPAPCPTRAFARVLFRPIFLAALLALASILSLVALAGHAAPPARAAGPETAQAVAAAPGCPWRPIPPSSCLVITNEARGPETLLLGESVDVTLTVTALCAGESYPLHVALLLDETASMSDAELREMRSMADELVRYLDLAWNPSTSATVVRVGTRARIACAMTRDSAALARCVRGGRPEGDASMAEGVALARGELRSARCAVHDARNARQILVLLSKGANEGRGEALAKEAAKAQREGILTIAVCVGRACNARALRGAASSRRYYVEDGDVSRVHLVLMQIRRQIRNVILKELEVVVPVSGGVASADTAVLPDGVALDAQPDRLTWRTSFVPKEGLTFTYALRPHEAGVLPALAGARGTFQDNVGRSGAFAFDDLDALVLAPRTLVAPPSATPTVTPTPSATPTPSPTPGPRIYLPRGLRMVLPGAGE